MFRNTHRLLRHLVASVAVVALAVPATSGAVDYRNPDSKAAAIEARSADLRSPDARDAGRVAQSAPEPPEIAKAPGFDWGDAGIGAGSVLGLALISLSVMFAVVHRHRKVEGSEGAAITT